MKKLIIGLAAIGAVIGLRHVAREGGHKMRAHCEQMMARCAGHDEATGRPEQPAAQFADRREPVGTA